MFKSLAGLVMAVCLVVPAAHAAKFKKAKNRIHNSYIVTFKDDVASADVDRLAAEITRQHRGNSSVP